MNESDKDKSDGTPSPASNNPKRQSLLLPSSRRATMLLRTIDHSQPPVDDPANPPELNVQRRQEYERVQKLNRTMETVIQNFESIATRIKVDCFSKDRYQGEKDSPLL
ncbi:hypothetical protein DM01DRAFT_1036931 [Hesseltinella vesiculosa]|uniref:Uncharacterized protein n=1 Tax=Hesseltinella vesiculosa TaxID=101127 RepID=A0A1X2GIJ6_9FUNG|nr:hypothetical protein DM01DRAFT_1036931 [Hesseltinella vesiculosa]